MQENFKIIVVDDEEIILESIKDYFEDYDIKTFCDPVKALEELNNGFYDIIITDYKMPSLNGLELLLEGKKNESYYYGILLTAFADKELLEEFINRNLIKKVLEKPLDLESLKKTIDTAISECKQKKDADKEILTIKSLYNRTREELDELKNDVIGTDGDLKNVYEKIKVVAKVDENILFQGETGSGKDLLAKLVHDLSKRKNEPFVKINCSAIPDNLIESEFFGYCKGAFSGAFKDKPGKIELAHKGTLFLDEMGELKPDLQTKLLHVIQDKSFERLGSNDVIKVDFRLISATNKKMDDLVARGLFREDLYYRISTIPVDVPPLRERKNDIKKLIGYLIGKYSSELNLKNVTISKSALDILEKYSWPGNIRELENVIKRALILIDRHTKTIDSANFEYLFYPDKISKKDLDLAISSITDEVINNKIDLKMIEKMIIEEILSRHDNNIMESVRITGIPKDRFYRLKDK